MRMHLIVEIYRYRESVLCIYLKTLIQFNQQFWYIHLLCVQPHNRLNICDSNMNWCGICCTLHMMCVYTMSNRYSFGWLHMKFEIACSGASFINANCVSRKYLIQKCNGLNGDKSAFAHDGCSYSLTHTHTHLKTRLFLWQRTLFYV